MDKRSADRIIVKSNARMEIVLDWFSKNREWLKKQEFHAPLDAGVVELQEELIEFTFESKGDLVELAVYPAEKPNLPAVVTYDYDPVTTQTSAISRTLSWSARTNIRSSRWCGRVLASH